MTDRRGISQSDSTTSHAPNGSERPVNKSPKHDTTSDSATPETGDDEAGHSTASEKLESDEHEEPLGGLDGIDHERNLSASIPRPPAFHGPAAASTNVEDGEGSSTTIEKRTALNFQVKYEQDSLHSGPRFRGQGATQPSINVDDGRRELEDANANDDSSSDISAKPETSLWKARMFAGKLVNNEYVQITIIFLIILNALFMGLATLDVVTKDPAVGDAFTNIDKGFLVIFTVEVGVQLFYLGATLFTDGWLVFDLLIVALSWSFESLQIVRSFRIFRAFRLITRVKPLRDLVLAIGAVMPRMYAIAALLLLIFYIFSVLFTELFSELPLSDRYFATLDTSLFTCMEMMTLEWGEIAREVMTHEPWAWAPFSAFIMITGFIVFNLIVAVVCDAVAITEKTVRELDGFEPDNPNQKLTEARERIDLLQCHISDMLRTQENVQNMIELMAGELLNAEAKRMKVEHQKPELRIEMNRRLVYERDMQSRQQIESLERSYTIERGRRESERRDKELRRKASLEAENPKGLGHSRILPEKKEVRRGSMGRGSGFLKEHSLRSRSSLEENLGGSHGSLSYNSPVPPRGMKRETSKASHKSFVSGSTNRS